MQFSFDLVTTCCTYDDNRSVSHLLGVTLFCMCGSDNFRQHYDNFSKGGFCFHNITLMRLMFFFFSLGNKQDNEGALNEDELHRRLELDTLIERYKCPCQVVS